MDSPIDVAQETEDTHVALNEFRREITGFDIQADASHQEQLEYHRHIRAQLANYPNDYHRYINWELGTMNPTVDITGRPPAYTVSTDLSGVPSIDLSGFFR